jgi:dipeptidyl aminopeptidase/acylaminoacyl peptidase
VRTKWTSLALATVLLVGVAVSTASNAQQPTSIVKRFEQVAISPDGSSVAWVEYNGGGEIFVQPLSGGSPRRISAGQDASENNVAWSPDSKQIAFLSDAAGRGQPQLYVANVASGKTRKLTELKGYLALPRWSPDGKTIALLFTENAPRRAGPLVPMTPDAGVVGKHIYEQRITTVDLASDAVRQVSPADMYVYEYDWSPDSKSFVATAAHGSGDNNWWIAQLYTMPAAGGAMQSIYKPAQQIAVPRWSPDGKTIAFISGLMSDQSVIGGDVFVVPSNGGEARDLTPNMHASASWLTWTGTGILFTENINGDAGIARVDLDGAPQQLWKGAESISGSPDVYGMTMSASADGTRTALMRESFEKPAEVWAGEIGKWHQLTNVNASAKRIWGSARSIEWNNEGLHVQGWLLEPQNYNPSGGYALIVYVHGGPASACTAGWPSPAMASLAASGYFVLCPNPRGSFGQGEAFTRGNVKDFGGGDFRDIMAGVDKVLADYHNIDPQRLGITGHSYGGYMTMWAVTQTHRFKAAVAGAGLSDWLSYYGENDIDQWMIPYFGASVYDDPAVYAKSSPINFVKNVKTPTLILVGDRDGEVPAPQSYEWYHALKTLGVPTELVVYPNEGHMISNPEHRRDMMVRTLEWFNKWLAKPQNANPPRSATSSGNPNFPAQPVQPGSARQ